MRGLCILLTSCMVSCSSPEKAEIVPLCVAGTEQCSSGGSTIQVCAEDGMAWEVVETCAGGASCIDAACQCPTREVLGSEGCLVPGIETCPEGFTQGELRCAVSPASCEAGEVYVVDECVPVGIASCPEAGWTVDPESGGCALSESVCGEGEDSVIGEGCLRPGLSKECGNPDLPWGSEAVEGDVVYAWADSPQAEETGSQSTPYKTLAAAVAAVPEGGTVKLGSGSYLGGLVIDKSVTITGKCAEQVSIDGSVEMAPPDSEFSGPYTIFVEAGHKVDFSGFTVVDEAPEAQNRAAGIFLLQSADSTLHDLRFSGLSGAAIDLHDCDNVSVHHIEVQEQSLFEGLGPYGQSSYGIFILGGDGHQVSFSRFEKTQGADIKAENTCPHIDHNHFALRGGLGGLPPMGIWVSVCPAQTAIIEANTFSSKMTHAILFEQGEVEIRRNTITGTVTDYNDLNGPAVKLDEADFVVADNLFFENQFAAINAVSSKGTIAGNRVDSGQPSDPGLKNGDGVIIKSCDPGPVFIEGNTIINNTRNGVLVTGSIAKIEGNVISGTQVSPSGNALYGAGLNIVDGADATIFGNSITRNHRLGIRFDNAYGWVEGNVIADTLPGDDDRCGGGIFVGGAKSSYLLNGVHRNLISNNYCAGLFVDNSNVGTVSNNVFVDTQGDNGSMGIGAVVLGSNCDLTRNWFVDNEDSGVLFNASTGTVIENVFEGNGTAGRGGGLVVQDSLHPKVEVTHNTFIGNGFAGTVVRGSQVELRRNAYIENVANGDGLGGVGAWLEANSEGDVRANYVYGNLLAGFLAYEVADLTISVNYIANTAIGSLPADPSPVQLGEGIVTAKQSFVSLLYNTSVNNKRAGIACFDSEGTVQSNTLLSNGGWGLELANSQMTISANLFRNNVQGAQTTAGDRSGPPDPLAPWEPCYGE